MFRDVRVLEFDQYIAGPVAGMLLGDLGADVIKVERPGGDPLRALPAYETWNRNKRIVELDLGSADGAAEVQRLIAGADVVIDGLRPGVLARAGIDVEQVLAAHPLLIHCTLPGFAGEMQMQGTPAWEPIIGAAAGLFQGSLTPTGEGAETVFTPLPFASTYAGILAADSIAAALFVRDRGGQGQRIEVPIHSALFLAIGFALQRVQGQAGGLGGMNPLVTTYQCADGRWIQLHCATPRFVDGFVSAAGLEEWWAEGLLDRGRWQSEPGLLIEMHERLKKLFAQKPAEQWETELSAAGLCCAVCRTVEEWVHHPHPEQSGLVVELPTARGPMRQPGRLVQNAEFRDAPLRPAAHVTLVEAEWHPRGAPAAPAPAPQRTKPPAALNGVRVLDLCLILAGPTCARTLAEFGADVIKIDAPDSTVLEPFWLDTNRGKRSIVLDLKTEEGQEILWKLLEAADIVVENFRKGVAERLGIGYEQVAARFPRIIYASMNCYGYEGPFADRPGWEQLAQAVSGMQTRYGGRDAQPRLARYAVNDYASGLAAALGVLGALHERERTGRGQRVTAALAATAGLLQSLYMFDYPGYERREIEGQEAKGWSALSRLYPTADGWIYLHCPRSRWNDLASVPEFADIAADPRATPDGGPDSWLAGALAERLRTKSASAWVEVLGQRGIAATPATDPAAMFDDPRLRAAGLLVTTEGGYRGAVEHVGLPHWFSLTPPTQGRPAPALGADTVAVLRELGYDDVVIARLLGRRAAVAHGL